MDILLIYTIYILIFFVIYCHCLQNRYTVKNEGASCSLRSCKLTGFDAVCSNRKSDSKGKFICVIYAYDRRENLRISKTSVGNRFGSLVLDKFLLS